MKSKRIISIGSIVLVMFTLAGCELLDPGSSQQRQVQSPGLYGLSGWQGMGVYYPSGCEYGKASDVDIDGTVGHQLFVRGCSANTVPADAGWQAEPWIVNGNLPPGLEFQNGHSPIVGIPTERGHWIVTLGLHYISCQGKSYKEFRQQLRFHITGSGEVH